MKTLKIVPIALLGLLISACGSSVSVSDEDKVQIDCLSAKTVVAIANTIHEGAQAGLSPDELSGVQANKTEDGLDILRATSLGSNAQNYFEFETARRLNGIQDALRLRDPASDEQKDMDETYELAETCKFEVG